VEHGGFEPPTPCLPGKCSPLLKGGVRDQHRPAGVPILPPCAALIVVRFDASIVVHRSCRAVQRLTPTHPSRSRGTKCKKAARHAGVPRCASSPYAIPSHQRNQRERLDGGGTIRPESRIRPRGIFGPWDRCPYSALPHRFRGRHRALDGRARTPAIGWLSQVSIDRHHRSPSGPNFVNGGACDMLARVNSGVAAVRPI